MYYNFNQIYSKYGYQSSNHTSAVGFELVKLLIFLKSSKMPKNKFTKSYIRGLFEIFHLRSHNFVPMMKRKDNMAIIQFLAAHRQRPMVIYKSMKAVTTVILIQQWLNDAIQYL